MFGNCLPINRQERKSEFVSEILLDLTDLTLKRNMVLHTIFRNMVLHTISRPVTEFCHTQMWNSNRSWSGNPFLESLYRRGQVTGQRVSKVQTTVWPSTGQRLPNVSNHDVSSEDEDKIESNSSLRNPKKKSITTTPSFNTHSVGIHFIETITVVEKMSMSVKVQIESAPPVREDRPLTDTRLDNNKRVGQ